MGEPTAAKVSTVHSVVSIARSSAVSALPAGGVERLRATASACTSPAAISPVMRASAARSSSGPASGGTARPGAGSQVTAPVTASWPSCPIAVPATVNASSSSSMWSGSRKPATGLTALPGSS